MNQKGQILIILLGILFFGSSATAIGVLLTGQTIKEIKKQVSVVISGKERVEKIDDILDSWSKFIQEQDKKVGGLRKEIFHLLKRHETHPEQMEELFSRIDDLNQESIAMIVNSRFALKEQLSADDWRRIFGREGKGASADEKLLATK